MVIYLIKPLVPYFLYIIDPVVSSETFWRRTGPSYLTLMVSGEIILFLRSPLIYFVLFFVDVLPHTTRNSPLPLATTLHRQARAHLNSTY